MCIGVRIFGLHPMVDEAQAGAFLILMTASQALLNERPVEMMTVEDLVRDETTDVIDLPPLPSDAHAALIKNLLFLDPGLALRVEERTAGNPLFAIHLIQDWIAGERFPSPTGYVPWKGHHRSCPSISRQFGLNESTNFLRALKRRM